MSLRAEKRSASGPPAKYDTMATIPYRENAVPSSKLLISNTARKVGLKTLAKTNGKRKAASPAATRVANIKPSCSRGCLDWVAVIVRTILSSGS